MADEVKPEGTGTPAAEPAASEKPETLAGTVTPPTTEAPASLESEIASDKPEATAEPFTLDDTLDVPEHIPVEQKKALAAYFAEHGFTKQQASTLTKTWIGALAEQAQEAKRVEAEAEQRAVEQSKQWVTTLKGNPEFANWDSTRANVALALKHLHPELQKTLDAWGVGMHPVIFTALARAGKLFGEADHVAGRAAGLSAEDERLMDLYPSAAKPR